MLNSYTSSTEVYAANANVLFNNNYINTSPCCIQHMPGSDTITIKQAGNYFISANATVNGNAGSIELQLNNNDEAIPGANGTYYSTSNTTPGTISLSTIISVKPSCAAIDNTAHITVQNIGVEATLENSNIVVIKIN